MALTQTIDLRTDKTRSQDHSGGTSPLVCARVAGVLYLLIFIVAPFAEFFVRGTLIVPGDATATAANIRASETMFRLGFASDLGVFVIEVVQAAILYVLLRPVSNTLALVMAFARLAQATGAGMNLLNQFTALQLVTRANDMAMVAEGQADALATVFLTAQRYGYDIALVYFALHLAVLGYLVFRSGFLPPFLGVLLVIAGVSYLANGAAMFVFPRFEAAMSEIVIVPTVIGELAFTLWLLIKGVNVERWEKSARESARHCDWLR